jgi:hypothetical protein
MTTYTRTMLANEALELLQMGGGLGGAPDAEDTQKMDRKIDAVLAELSERGIVDIPDVGDIPPAYFSPLAEILANEAAPNFSKQKNPAVRESAEERLKIMTNNTPATNKTLGVDRSLPTGRRTGLSLARWTTGG